MTLATLVCLAALAPPREQVTLVFKPALNDKATYERTMAFKSTDGTETYERVDRVSTRISQRDSKGRFGVETSYTLLKESIDGEQLDVPTNMKPGVTRETRTPQGALAIRSVVATDNPLDVFYAALATPALNQVPVGIGDTWTHAYNLFSDEDLPVFQGTFQLIKLLPVEKPTQAVLRASFADSSPKPLTAEGTITVRLDDGALVGLDLQLPRAYIPGGDATTYQLHLTWNLIARNPATKPKPVVRE
ncbi:MAG: hypothetical protein JNM85_01000 [Chthonomonas sp.]|nr:hypothetical protein [Chthonomonas sp.]